jgi:hypothetical protein
MILNFSLPLRTRAVPPKSNGIRDIYVAHSVTVDVPEINKDKTEAALEVYGYIERANGYSDCGEVDLVETVHEQLVQLRIFEGQLYRNISHNIRRDQDKSHHLPFPRTIGSPVIDDSLYLAGGEFDVINYVAASLVRQHDWDLVKQSGSDSKILTAWPTQYGGVLSRFDARNGTKWEEIASSLDNTDHALVDDSMHMIETHLKKLIVIDNELWIQCLPPTWCVEVKPDHLNPDTASSYHVLLSLKVLPDGFDPELSRRYFPLNQLQEALAFQNFLVNLGSDGKGTFLPSRLIPDHHVIDPKIIEADVGEYEMRRFTYSLTTEIGRYLRKNPAKYQSLDPTLKEFIDRQIEAVSHANYVTGVHTDLSDQLDELIFVWNKLNKPLSYCNMVPARLKIANYWIADMNEVLSNRFITLDTAVVKNPFKL